ncbi:NnrS family protein [Nitrosomonas sp. ANs5]|uniref:NnrS family protein n=1 Tax=Nitrosomonas sp. ANs5 TaxID=3423941 RepID=UPI003D340EFB
MNAFLKGLPGETKVQAHQWFFMAASMYALGMVPLAMLARHGYGPVALATPTGHAYEMLFGFALALIAGYLLGPMPARRLAGFLSVWLLARITGLIAPLEWLTVWVNAVFVGLLAWHMLPRLWVAKKWRNRLLAPLLGLICAMTVLIALMGHLDYHWLARAFLDESVLLFALLMLFMGGRMLAPAVAGEFYRQGKELEARVQPHIEAALIVTVVAAFALAPLTAYVAGLLLCTSGVLAGVRLLRWQLWHCLARPDLLCLGVGYGWLALGLLLLGWVKLNGGVHFSTAVHALTVGALGTLAANVIVRVTLLQVRQYPSRIKPIVMLTACMSAAAILRIGADLSAHRELLLMLAALAWSGTFLQVLIIQLDCRAYVPSRHKLSRDSVD